MSEAPVPTKTLRLPEVLDLLAAAPLAETLLNSRGANVVIDASPVQRVGTQCLQVLLCAASAWRTEGLSLAVANRSPAFAEGLQLLGIPADTFLEGEMQQ
jgi:chemotaxis protein CheX